MQWTVRTNSPCENTYIREDANEYSNNSPSGHSCYPDRCTDRFIFLRKKSPEETGRKEIKAEVSGLYIVGVKGIRGSLQTPAPKKKGFFAKFKKDKTAR